MSRFTLAVDLGQTIDPTAVAVLEAHTRRDAVHAQYEAPDSELAKLVQLDWFKTVPDRSGSLKYPDRLVHLDVRHLVRLPLRMPYPEQVAYVASLLRRAPLNGGRTRLVVDQTGVGRPVMDLLRRGGLRPIGITITAGDKWSHAEGGDYRVSKLLLVSQLQAMLNDGTLRIAKDLSERQALVTELMDFRANISEAGYTRFGAREGTHDDLVLAVAIGAWIAGENAGRVTTGTFAI
ncbi:MAG: hypothetical protein HY275_03580 [Gemmatimonadetes bacterium]|nr:hypothetical protein [Gemmatimonadota bacterium]